jgi:putative ABC transport system permease protein
MTWLETLLTGFNAIRTHRLRSALTVVGIMIGIAAVILTVGLGQGAQNQVASEINALGRNLLTVTPGSSTSSSGIREGFGSASTLSESNATALRSKTVAPDIKTVAPVISSSESLSAGTSTWTSTVNGTTPSWESVRSRSVTQGRFIDDEDVSRGSAVAVLGTTTASELFRGVDPVGQTVKVDGLPMTVIGVLNAVGSSSTTTGSNQDDQVVVPITTAMQQIFGSTSLSAILIQATSSTTLSAAYQEADGELLALHGISTPENADFTITSEQSLVSTSTSVDHTLTILLGGIAGISLLVGGIGVMNVMLVSVTERVREIGLRKALGATPKLIRRQFLFEALLLGLTGGALGALLAAPSTALLPHAIGYPISMSAVATVGALFVAIAIGVIFGVYPASRAARLAPIDALRSE